MVSSFSKKNKVLLRNKCPKTRIALGLGLRKNRFYLTTSERKVVSIKASVVVRASSERVWSIVSDIDREPEFWKGLNSAKVTKREGSVIEREVDVGFMGHSGHQIIKLDRDNLTIEVEMTNGPLIGSRTMKLVPLQNGANTRLEASWNFSFSKVPIFARGFVKSQIENVTKNALEKIALESQEKKAKYSVTMVSSK